MAAAPPAVTPTLTRLTVQAVTRQQLTAATRIAAQIVTSSPNPRSATRIAVQAVTVAPNPRGLTRLAVQTVTVAPNPRGMTRLAVQAVSLAPDVRVMTRLVVQAVSEAVTLQPITARPINDPPPQFQPVNWRDIVTVETTWATDVQAARITGAEDRRSLTSRPIRRTRGTMTALGRFTSHILSMASMRRGHSQNPFPIYPDRARLTSDVPASSTQLPCITDRRRFVYGGRVLIVSYDPELQGVATPEPWVVEYGIVRAIAGAYIVLAEPTARDHAAWSSVYPCFDADISLQEQSTAVTDMTVETSFDVRESAGSFTLPGHPASAKTRLGVPVFVARINWATSVAAMYFRQGTEDQKGRVLVSSTDAPRTQVGYRFTVTALTRVQWWDVLGFFNHCRGRARSFWFVHPIRHALMVYEFEFDLTKGWYAVDILPHGEFRDVAEFLRAVAIILKDGRVYVREVVAFDVSHGLIVTWKLTFDEAIPLFTEFEPEDVKYVVPASRVRFATDTLAEEWVTNEVVNMQFDLISTFDESPRYVEWLGYEVE